MGGKEGDNGEYFSEKHDLCIPLLRTCPSDVDKSKLCILNLEWYLLDLDYFTRITLSKFRCGGHKLPIARGRYLDANTPMYVVWIICTGWWIYHYTFVTLSNHVTSSKQVDTIICHTTMHWNTNNVLYNRGHVILYCVEVSQVANAREGSMQEHDSARVHICLPSSKYR